MYDFIECYNNCVTYGFTGKCISSVDITTAVLHMEFTQMSLLDITTIVSHMELKVDVCLCWMLQ